MTTNVFDGGQGLICTDSRWSISYGRWIVFVDDVDYHKIALRDRHAVMFAGKGHRIDEWKNWLQQPVLDMDAFPSTEGIVVCLIDIQSRRVAFQVGVDVKREDAVFAGSGSRAAVVCWMSNKCARLAVQSAIAVDPFSGGEVRFFDLTSGSNNLRPSPPQRVATLADVSKAIELRGTIMDLSSRSTAPFGEQKLVGCDEDAQREIQALLEGFADQSIRPAAPCDGMYQDWTPEQVSACKDAFRAAFCS